MSTKYELSNAISTAAAFPPVLVFSGSCSISLHRHEVGGAVPLSFILHFAVISFLRGERAYLEGQLATKTEVLGLNPSPGQENFSLLLRAHPPLNRNLSFLRPGESKGERKANCLIIPHAKNNQDLTLGSPNA
ncbi:hypothetical protein PoB_004168800 [Plakobranchus ocellatus]|uniref:Uncharacterized protein n=1 Tax=Plakobranchus ocellatus TaxID=259542 RepID=A0AAV4B7Q6_9GAST|nr:hypothetical protein PoB_004168800 [Plakobranchus ocellatus]